MCAHYLIPFLDATCSFSNILIRTYYDSLGATCPFKLPKASYGKLLEASLLFIKLGSCTPASDCPHSFL